jgi:hypothetical protein
VKRSLSILGLIVLLLWLGPFSRAQDQQPATNTISGKINLTIVGVTYDTLTLANCFNVDLVNCTIKNLVLIRCWNVDVTNSAFVGEGIAVLADTSMAVATTGCTFAESYSQRLMSIHSALITIE